MRPSFGSQPRLTHSGNRNPQRFRKIFMRNPIKEIIGSFSEIHVCTPIDIP